MKSLPKLFSRNTDGSVQEWTIFIQNDKFWTEVGRVGGKTVIHDETTCLPKNIGKRNETTGEQQAFSEALSRWKKKKKTGCFENLEEIDNFYFVEPMLALALKKVTGGIKFPCWVQCKYNGGRFLIKKDGIFSRKGERYLCAPHISEALVPFFESEPFAVLDGEGYAYEHRQKLNKIMSLIRKTVDITPEDLAESRELIKYYVYDGYGFSGTSEETPYKIRKAGIDRIVKTYGEPLRLVQSFLCETQEQLDEIYQSFLNDGQEGAIIRYADNTYEHKRTKNLIKLKPTDDDEFLITGFSDAAGDWAGTAKTLHLKRIDGGFYEDGTDTVDASFKGKHEEAAYVWNHQEEFIGQIVTIFYNGLTGKGKPNYAQFDYNNYKHDKTLGK